MRKELEEKIERSLKILHMASKAANQKMELCFSGGKDSEVILQLAKLAHIDFEPIYKNTTIDPPGTITHNLEKGCTIIQPKQPFFKLIEHNGLPTRRVRFCCSILKEYKIMDYAIVGVRREESRERAARYNIDDPIICRIYKASARCQQVLPILEWTKQDVMDFIIDEHIQCHPIYYHSGHFDPNVRLGCMACPLQGDRGRADFLKHPKLLRCWIRHAQIWWDTHPTAKSHDKFGSVYALMAHNLFYRDYATWLRDDTAPFGNTTWRDKLSSYFEINL